MPKQNHFSGATLAEAVINATAAYRRRGPLCEVKNQRRCNDLLLKINNLSLQAGRYEDEADRLRDEADSLRDEALRLGLVALVSALGGFIAAAVRARRAAQALQAMRKGNLSRKTIEDFLLAFGILGSALSTYFIAEKLIDADRLERRAQDLSSRAERYGQDYMRAFNEYDRLGCGESPSFTGT